MLHPSHILKNDILTPGVLKTLFLGPGGDGVVWIREANFGYIIRSERAGQDAGMRRWGMRLALAGLWGALALLWLVPGIGLPVKLAASGVLLALGGLVLVTARRRDSGFELHVDTARRELRSAILTPKGESWIRTSARFGEVTKPVLRKGKIQSNKRSLCLRIAGEAEEIPVAIGDERTLLAIHDRLMRDLRPLEERLAGMAGTGGGAARNGPARRTGAGKPSGRAKVFPPLGPDEVAA